MRFSRILPIIAVPATVAACLELFKCDTLWVFSFAFLPAFLAWQLLLNVLDLSWTPGYLALFAHGIVFYALLGRLIDGLVTRPEGRPYAAAGFFLGLIVVLGIAVANSLPDSCAYVYHDVYQLAVPSVLWALIGLVLVFVCARRLRSK